MTLYISTVSSHPIISIVTVCVGVQVITDLELSAIETSSDAPVVIHGTYFRNWNSIQKEGLSRMNRQHVHFSPGEPGSDKVISGMRSTCQVWIYIDLSKALAGSGVS